ncbi:MAG: hypothetical protein ABEJ57_01075 [Halobacteriaceae archaeon]
MSAAEERSLFEPGTDAVTVLVAAQTGVVAVTVAGDRVGSFGLLERCLARDVAVRGDRVAVATAEDVLIGADGDLGPTGFGPAVAVGTGDGLVAAAPDGRVGRFQDGGWTDLGSCASVAAIADGFVAAADGVHRVAPGLPGIGLSQLADVTGAPVPRAATADGLYRLGNGWMAELDGAATVVAGTADGDRVHAVVGDALLAYRDGDWTRATIPVAAPVVDIDYGPGTYALTGGGTFLASVGDGWRTRELGVVDAGGLAVVSG